VIAVLRTGVVVLAALAAGCDGPQSALAPAGRDAERIAALFTWMAIGTAVIWAAVVLLGAVAGRVPALAAPRAGSALIVGGGVVLPLVVLTPLLAFNLAELRRVLAPGDGLTIDVTGTQWWWRVRYLAPDGGVVAELANEVRLPVGRRVNLRLRSADVVHSFWIPSLAGKMDMVPGRVNRLALEPVREGTFRGACAEFCGASHARMSLMVVVVDEPAFTAWLDRQRAPAAPPGGPAQERGQAAFQAHGCATCHTIRGSPAAGAVGPDLTHVGGRVSLAAATLPNDPASIRRWVASTHLLKPGVRMPAFDALPAETLNDLAAYLSGLQ
jgi:cytochrome c oxidase subunit 2